MFQVKIDVDVLSPPLKITRELLEQNRYKTWYLHGNNQFGDINPKV